MEDFRIFPKKMEITLKLSLKLFYRNIMKIHSWRKRSFHDRNHKKLWTCIHKETVNSVCSDKISRKVGHCTKMISLLDNIPVRAG